MFTDTQIEQVQKFLYERRMVQRVEHKSCDLCGISNSKLVEGLCEQCVQKYNLERK